MWISRICSSLLQSVPRVSAEIIRKIATMQEIATGIDNRMKKRCTLSHVFTEGEHDLPIRKELGLVEFLMRSELVWGAFSQGF